MARHAFTEAVAAADLEGLIASMTEDAVLHSPILATKGDELHGRTLVAEVLGGAMAGFGVPKDVAEFNGPAGQFVVTFHGTIRGHRLDVSMTMMTSGDGKVDDLRIHMRPSPIVQYFRDHMMLMCCPNPAPVAMWLLPDEYPLGP